MRIRHIILNDEGGQHYEYPRHLFLETNYEVYHHKVTSDMYLFQNIQIVHTSLATKVYLANCPTEPVCT